MRLSQITTHSFRNLSPDPLFFGPGVTLVTGGNAQGKTNLLEAVALLCGQRSFRRAPPTAMASGGRAFSIGGAVLRGGQVEKLEVAWSQGAGRRFNRGGKAISFREASRLAPAVFLSPEHRALLTDSPAVRRSFLDRLALASRPAAGEDLERYGRALQERNALLSRLREGDSAPGELEAWTEELIRAGAAVRRHRRQALAEWLKFFRLLAQQAGPAYSAIQVAYVADGETEEQLRAACARVAAIERRRGHSLAGPHRDDLSFTRAGSPLAAQASAGEIHRTVALAKLAEWHTVVQARGEAPLFAVDEFDSGLSVGAVEEFWRSLPPAETVLLTTASDPSRWRRFAGAVIEIHAGAVVDRLRAVND